MARQPRWQFRRNRTPQSAENQRVPRTRRPAPTVFSSRTFPPRTAWLLASIHLVRQPNGKTTAVLQPTQMAADTMLQPLRTSLVELRIVLTQKLCATRLKRNRDYNFTFTLVMTK